MLILKLRKVQTYIKCNKVIIINYEERINKLNSLEKFKNEENQDDILLMLDKRYGEDKWKEEFMLEKEERA